MDNRKRVNAQMRALITGTFGCLDAAADTINAATGGNVGKGTISKRLSGALDWPVAEVMALEDAAQQYPVTRMMARRIAAAEASPACVLTLAGRISKEVGEAVSAILETRDSDDKSKALAEIDEALAVLRQARTELEHE